MLPHNTTGGVGCHRETRKVAATALSTTESLPKKIATKSRKARAAARLAAVPADDSVEHPLVKATRLELEGAGKVDTMLGQEALTLAKQLSASGTMGLAAFSRELRAVMAALVGAQADAGAGDLVDELRARRDAKRLFQ